MIVLMTLLACGEEDVEDPGAIACAAVGETDATVDAGADAESAPEVGEYSATQVNLVVDAPSYVTIHGHGEDTLLFVDTADVVMSISLGDEVLAAEEAPAEDCGDDLQHFEMHLDEGEWLVELGPAAVDSVWLMLTEGHAGDHDHE